MSRHNDIGLIYNDYVDDMYTYATCLGFEENDIIDAIQDVFYNLCRSEKNIGDISDIKFYLLKSLRNRLVDIIKKEKLTVSLTNSPTLQTTMCETGSHVEDLLINHEDEQEIQRKIKEMLAILSPRQREIIYLHFIEGYDHAEVAEMMGLRYDNVRKMIYKSFKKLREKFGISHLLICLLSVCTVV